MIIELYGLPGSGKTTYAKALAREGGFEIIKIHHRTELIRRNILFFLRHPVKVSRLFFYTFRHAGSSSLLRYKMINLFLESNAKYHKALSVERAIIDQGYFQNFLSLFEHPAKKSELEKYLRFVFLPDTLVAFDIPEDILEKRLEKRGYGVREDRSAAYRARWQIAVRQNHALVVSLMKEIPVKSFFIKNDAEGEEVFTTLLHPARPLYYLANSRMPTEKAHGFQIARACEEFSRMGFSVELFVPSRKNPITEDIFTFYGVSRNFSVRMIRMPDIIRYHSFLKGAAFWLQSLGFLLKLRKKSFDKTGIIYTRNPEIAWFFKRRGFFTLYEAHNWPESKVGTYLFLIRKVDHIVCNSNGTEQKFRESGFTNTLVAHNGVDVEKFLVNEKKRGDIKKELGIPLSKKIVMYVGHFYTWKGTNTVLDAWEADFSKRDDVALVLVGGGEPKPHPKAPNIFWEGYQSRTVIPKYLFCADILLLPNAPVNDESKFYTSPIKMFEYMAARKPIIASDLPSIREILNEKNALLFEAGSSKELSLKITTLLEDEALGKKLAEKSFEDVKNYTWENRAKKIVSLFPKA
jgi:glycosyltransferase involved in cell wall biosynthesis